MASLIRLLIGVPIAGAITFMLFMLMQILIFTDEVELDEAGEDIRISISEVPDEVVARAREVNIDDVDTVEPPPPPPEIEREVADQPTEDLGTQLGELPEFDAPDLSNNISFDVSDRDAQPLVRIEPQYPERAASRGIDGDCFVRFDVTPDGVTANVTVIRCDSSLLERSSIRAVERWKYQPKIVDGTPVWRRGVETKFEYNLED